MSAKELRICSMEVFDLTKSKEEYENWRDIIISVVNMQFDCDIFYMTIALPINYANKMIWLDWRSISTKECNINSGYKTAVEYLEKCTIAMAAVNREDVYQVYVYFGDPRDDDQDIYEVIFDSTTLLN